MDTSCPRDDAINFWFGYPHMEGSQATLKVAKKSLNKFSKVSCCAQGRATDPGVVMHTQGGPPNMSGRDLFRFAILAFHSFLDFLRLVLLIYELWLAQKREKIKKARSLKAV